MNNTINIINVGLGDKRKSIIDLCSKNKFDMNLILILTCRSNTYRIRDDTNYGFWAKPERKKSININLPTCSLRLKSYNEKKNPD